MTKERFKMIAAVYLILKKEGRVLLLKRHNTGYQDGNYSLIAGHVEEGESLSACMIREAAEEAGIGVKQQDLELVHVLYRPVLGRMCFFFVCQVWEGTPENREPHKCSELRWFDIEQLPPNCVPELGQAIENYQQRKMYSDFEEE